MIDIKAKTTKGNTWEEIGEINVGHYNRFLYRIMKFNETYPFVIISDRLKKHYGKFYFKFDEQYYSFCSSELCVNEPLKEADCNNKPEMIKEKKLSDNPETLIAETEQLFGITMQKNIYRQLPVGIFKEAKHKCNAVFTGGASAIDLWGISEDRKSLCIYELKIEGNEKVGIISELFFYANLLFDIYSDNKNFSTIKNKKKKYRGYELLQDLSDIQKVCAVFLSPKLHLAITEEVIQKLNTTNIEFNKINY